MPLRPRQTDPTPVDPALPKRPAMLVVVCLLVVVEAALLLGLAVAFGVEAVRGANIPGAMVFLLAFLVGIAALLGACVRGLWRGRRWARSPVLTWQLLLAALAIGWLGVEKTWWAVGVLGAAIVIGIGLVLPSVVTATTGPREGD